MGSGCGKDGNGFRVQGLGLMVEGLGCRVDVSGFRVQGSGFRAWAIWNTFSKGFCVVALHTKYKLYIVSINFFFYVYCKK